jgi:ketosteroid isomerase-like protein
LAVVGILGVMSQENVEVVRRFYKVHGDPVQVLSLFDPDVVVVNIASAPETTPYSGHAGVGDVDENRVVVVGRVCGTGPSSGLAVELHLSTVYTLSDGKFIRVHGRNEGRRPRSRGTAGVGRRARTT